MERPSFWSKCSKTWHHRFPPYIFLLFSCSLIIGWTECKRQYEQRGSMPVGAWWRSAAKCIVVNQQLHGSKSKQWVAMLEDIHHHTFFSWANTKISIVWETTNRFTCATTDEIEHCVCFFSSADFWMDCHLHNCVHKVPPQYPRDPFCSNGAWTECFSMGKSCWRNGGLTTLCGHGKWLFEKIGQVSEKQRIWELQSEPQIREAYLRKKLQKIVIAPSLWGLVPAWGTIIRWFFFHFSSGLNREVKVSKLKSDTRKNNFFLWPTKKENKSFPGPVWAEKLARSGLKKRQWIEIPNLHVWFKCPSRRKKACQNDWSVDLWALFGAGKKHLYVTGASASLEKNNLKRECWKKPLEKIERYTPLLTPVSAFLKNIQPFDRRFFQEH